LERTRTCVTTVADLEALEIGTSGRQSRVIFLRISVSWLHYVGRGRGKRLQYAKRETLLYRAPGNIMKGGRRNHEARRKCDPLLILEEIAGVGNIRKRPRETEEGTEAVRCLLLTRTIAGEVEHDRKGVLREELRSVVVWKAYSITSKSEREEKGGG